MEGLAQLHPVAQIGIPLIIAGAICFVIYQLLKTARES